MSNVAAVEQVWAINFIHIFECSLSRLGECVALAHHYQHTAACGDGFALFQCGAHMVDAALKLVKSANFEPFFVALGVAFRGQNYTQCGAIAPLYLVVATLQNRIEHLKNVATHTRQHHFGFGVAESCIKLNDLYALGSLHQSAIEHSAKRHSL